MVAAELNTFLLMAVHVAVHGRKCQVYERCRIPETGNRKMRDQSWPLDRQKIAKGRIAISILISKLFSSL